ncbi:S-layer homology domain-containing protein [Alteribacillus bidgolensis]|uniref:Transglycosylase SLT domain-containing protein n=1 Tax=Alteribacillus bidgolensis TaxID=930129 RepID=A0A1G8DYD0_9BACI|nr:S-layer homology domain-containing protein [Alteribacillus bidgolensis]SDH62663.1 Transglycosylase SLT domain-containing protein [Alteribacillus bidgolensis]
MNKWLAAAAIAGAAVLFSTPGFAADDEAKTPGEEELSFKEKKDLLTETALEHDIPPEILKAIAFEETGMRQFDDEGNPIRNENDDGGIGMMQVTLNEDDLENRQVDRERLETDTAYNIEVGADLLNEKFEWSGSVIPQVNDGDREVLENWYFAVLAYNGLDRRNDPNENDHTYQDDLYESLADNNLFETDFDLPEFEAQYRDDGNRMWFSEDQLNITTEQTTRSLQMFEEGDKVYSYSKDVSAIRFREEPAVSSREVGEVALYTPLTVEGPLEHDNNIANHFGFYPLYYADIHGYMASTYVREGTVTVFSDVRRQELTEAVGFLEVQDIISGYPDGTFRPNEPIYRRHAASMLSKALGLEVPEDYELKAADMNKDDLGYKAMKTVEYHGFMTGSGENIRPNENMTRAQMASVLAAAFEAKLPADPKAHQFEDVPLDFWNYNAINILYQSGLTNQDPYRPGEDVTRSQFALFLQRAMMMEE